MSGKKTKDYKAVIKVVLEMLPVPPAVKKITLDYEIAVGKTLRELMSNVDIVGCVFHWMQHCGERYVSDVSYTVFQIKFN